MTDAAYHHPVALQGVIFTKSFVEAMGGHEPGSGAVVPAPTNAFDVQRDPQDPELYQVTLRSVVNPDRDRAYPYYVEMECLALLRVDKSLSDDEARRGALITGHNVLYGAVREATAWITGRQIFGPMILGLSVLRPQPASDTKEPAEQK